MEKQTPHNICDCITNSQVKTQLEAQSAQRQIEFQKQQQAARANAPSTTDAAAPPVVGGSKYTQVASYAWDQSEKFVSIYISCEGIGQEKDNVKCTFGHHAFAMTMDLDKAGGKNTPRFQQLKVNDLCKKIDAGKSKILVKADR